MKKDVQERLDTILAGEVARGYKVMDVPVDVQAQLQAAGLPSFTRVRFTRMNPRRKAKISEVVQRSYFKDMKDKELPSHEQLIALATERGEWSQESEDRRDALVRLVDAEQKALFFQGGMDEDWASDIMQVAEEYRSEIAKAGPEEGYRKELLDTFDRWVLYTPDRAQEYTDKFAASQNAEAYLPDRDYNWLLDNAPNPGCVALLERLDDLRDRLQRFTALVKDRTELVSLQDRYSRITAGSAESKRDALQELATLFYCIELVDESGNPTGPLVKELDLLWDFPEDVIQWLQVYYYLFANGVPDEAEEYLRTFGFLKAGRAKTEETTETGDSTLSVESHDPQSSKSDTTEAEETPVVSSV